MQVIYGSHGAIAPFRLERPPAAADAAAALAAAGRDGAAFAGGVDLVPAMRAGRRLKTLVSLDRIDELRAIRRRDDTLIVGAGVTYARLAEEPAVRAALPDLAGIWSAVANARIRACATLGGNVMAGNPAYDALPALMALDSRLIFVTADGARRAVDPGIEPLPQGLLAAVEIPLPAFRRFVFDRSCKPVASVALSIERRDARLSGRAAFGCAHRGPVALTLALGESVEMVGVAGHAAAIAEEAARRLPEPLDDHVAGAAYRRHLAQVLLRRALASLASNHDR